MDFADKIKALAAEIPGKLPHSKSEAGTKNYLVEPFLNAWGYDTTNPLEVEPDFPSHGMPGAKKGDHVDYAIRKDGKIIILIEVKAYPNAPGVGLDQLYDYFHKAHEVKVGVATNGAIYRFYTDLEKLHIMDKTPFLEIDMQALKDSDIEELKKLSKPEFQTNDVVARANELKYIGGIVKLLTEQLKSPHDNFVKFFFQELCPGKSFAGAMKSDFSIFVQEALKEFAPRGITPVVSPDPDPGKIKTTEEELEGFYIVKSILIETTTPNKVTYKDMVSYFNILFEGKTTKPICRLHFNNTAAKKLELFSYDAVVGKTSEKIAIASLDDIYSYADRLKATMEYYLKRVSS